MNILDQILEHKSQEISLRRSRIPESELQKSPYFARSPLSLKNILCARNAAGIIAEIKRRSPSKGVIKEGISVVDLARGYAQAGASALSVLTDEKYFGGSLADLEQARKEVNCPILRKDFVIDEYQVLEARAYGADLILLIARALPPLRIAQLSQFAKSLGLEILLEVHSREELIEAYSQSPLIDLVGVNNRDLRTFEVSLTRSLELAEYLPADVAAISESGIVTPEDLELLMNAGYVGFLIGESFMREASPEDACRKLTDALRRRRG